MTTTIQHRIPLCCDTCGTDEPHRFAVGRRSRCNACEVKVKRTKARPHCRCGEDRPEMFYPSQPYACRRCNNANTRGRR